MVTEYGMSDEVGPRKLGNTKGEVFLGKDIAHEADYSQSMAMTIDAEVERFVNLAHDEARAILESHIDTLDALAEALLEHETLDKEQLDAIFGNIEWHRGFECVHQFRARHHDRSAIARRQTPGVGRRDSGR